MDLLRSAGGAAAESANVRWRQLPAPRTGDLPPPSPRSGHVAVSVRSEQWATEFVVVFGGLSDRKEFLGDSVVLETAEGQWIRPVQEGGISPGPRAFHAACAVGPRVYLFGGSWSPRNRYQADLWCLDTDEWQWKLVETLNPPQPRDFPTLVHLGGNLMVLYGGYSGTKFMSDIHVFDIATGVWQEITAEGLGAQQPAARSGHAATAVAQRLAVLGGETTSNTMLSDFWTLRGLQGDGPIRWTKLNFKGQSPTARGAHSVADVGSKLVVFGGHGEEGFLQRRSVYYGDTYVLDREAEAGPVWLKVDPGAHGPSEAPEGRAYHTLTAVHGKRALMFGGCNGTMKATFGDAWWLILEGSPYWDQGGPTPSAQPVARAPPSAAQPPSQQPQQQQHQPQQQQHTASVQQLKDSQAATAQAAEPVGPVPALPSSGANAVDLRKALGIPAGGPVPPPQPQSAASAAPYTHDKDALVQLGRRELSLGQQQQQRQRQVVAPPDECTAAARRFLSGVKPNTLKLGDLEALLTDYRALSAAAYSAAAASPSPSDLPRSLLALPGRRFLHFRREQLRVSDVPFLLDDYRHLLSVVSGAQ